MGMRVMRTFYAWMGSAFGFQKFTQKYENTPWITFRTIMKMRDI